MSILGISQTIKEARKRLGLSQRQLSEGICSITALCNIENDKYGVSPSTFEALMSKMGIHCKVYPTFENQNDYECFKHIEDATSYLRYCKLDLVYQELENLQSKSYNHNYNYYQKWLYLYSHLMIIDKRYDTDIILDCLKKGFLLSQSSFDLEKLDPVSYNYSETNLLLFYAFFILDRQEDYSLCKNILDQLESHCSHDQTTSFLYAFIQCYYFYKTEQFDEAYEYAKQLQLKSLSDGNYTFIIFSLYIKGLSLLPKKHLKEAKTYINASVDTSIIYSPLLTDALIRHINSIAPDLELKLSLDVPDVKIPNLLSLDFPNNLKDGYFNIYSKNVIGLGDIILHRRTSQKISQIKLCQGLCSKSALSKIEQGKSKASILVSMGLLERLGLSSREFCFYGSQQETAFYKIVLTLISHYRFHLDKQKYTSYIDDLIAIADNDPLMLQYCYLFKTQLTANKTEIINLCKKALNITIPNFELINIPQYRFSNVEMNFINVLVNAIAFSDNFSDAPYYFQLIYQYATDNNIELLWKKNYLAVALAKYVRFLGEKEMYSVLLARYKQWDFSCCYFYLDVLLDIYYYLSKAYHSIGDLDNALKYKSILTSIAIILNNVHALEHIQTDLDFDKI